MKITIADQFTKACEEHSDALFRYCFFKIRDREAAKDFVQETFMRTWTCMSKGEEIKNIRAFFYRILSNLIIDEYRRKKIMSLDSLCEGGFEPIANEAENVENKIDGKIALMMLDKIPKMYKEIIFMRYVQDLSIEEIADITKESKNAVSVKVHRGLRKVAKIFNQN